MEQSGTGASGAVRAPFDRRAMLCAARRAGGVCLGRRLYVRRVGPAVVGAGGAPGRTGGQTGGVCAIVVRKVAVDDSGDAGSDEGRRSICAAGPVAPAGTTAEHLPGRVGGHSHCVGVAGSDRRAVGDAGGGPWGGRDEIVRKAQ